MLMNFVAEHFGRIDCVAKNAGAGGEGGQSQKLPSKDLISPSRWYGATR
jgi:hypothetical protein